MTATIGVAALLACSDASAAVLSGLATSVGLLATLLSIVALAVLPSSPPSSAALSTAGAVLLVAAAAGAWFRRPRQWPGLAAATGGAVAGAMTPPLHPAAAPAPPAALTAEFCEQFVRLQAAWDCGEMPVLRQLTTPRIFEDVCAELAGRAGVHGLNRTDVVTLRADVLGLEDFPDLRLASVQFSGLLREAPEQGAVPFRELWILARSKDDESGWKLARQQTLL